MYIHTYNKKKDAETLGPEEGEVKKWHSKENYTVKYASFVAYMALAEKTVRPSSDCWYQQTWPAQFGQNHPSSPHQAITATIKAGSNFFLPMTYYFSSSQSQKLPKILFWGLACSTHTAWGGGGGSDRGCQVYCCTEGRG